MPNKKQVKKNNKQTIFNQEVINTNKKKCKFVSKIVNKVVKVTNKEFTLHSLKNCTVRNFKNMRDKIDKCDLNSSVATGSSKTRTSTSSNDLNSSKRRKLSTSYREESSKCEAHLFNHNISYESSRIDTTLSDKAMSFYYDEENSNKSSLSAIKSLFDTPTSKKTKRRPKKISESFDSGEENSNNKSNIIGVKSLDISRCSSKKPKQRSEKEIEYFHSKEENCNKLNLNGVKPLFEASKNETSFKKIEFVNLGEENDDQTNLTGVKNLFDTSSCSSQKGTKRCDSESLDSQEENLDKSNLSGIISLTDCSSKNIKKRRKSVNKIKPNDFDSERLKLIQDLVNQQKKELSLTDDDADTSDSGVSDSEYWTEREQRGKNSLKKIKELRKLPDYEKIDKFLNAPPKTYYQKSLQSSLNILPDESKSIQHWNKYSFLCRKIEQCVLQKEWYSLTKLLILLADASTIYKPFLLKTTLINILCNPAVQDEFMVQEFLKACYSCQTDEDVGRVLADLFHLKNRQNADEEEETADEVTLKQNNVPVL